jgi:hypothetical protein
MKQTYIVLLVVYQVCVEFWTQKFFGPENGQFSQIK